MLYFVLVVLIGTHVITDTRHYPSRSACNIAAQAAIMKGTATVAVCGKVTEA